MTTETHVINSQVNGKATKLFTEVILVQSAFEVAVKKVFGRT